MSPRRRADVCLPVEQWAGPVVIGERVEDLTCPCPGTEVIHVESAGEVICLGVEHLRGPAHLHRVGFRSCGRQRGHERQCDSEGVGRIGITEEKVSWYCIKSSSIVVSAPVTESSSRVAVLG